MACRQNTAKNAGNPFDRRPTHAVQGRHHGTLANLCSQTVRWNVDLTGHALAVHDAQSGRGVGRLWWLFSSMVMEEQVTVQGSEKARIQVPTRPRVLCTVLESVFIVDPSCLLSSGKWQSSRALHFSASFMVVCKNFGGWVGTLGVATGASTRQHILVA